MPIPRSFMISERWSINDSAKIYNLDNWGGDLSFHQQEGEHMFPFLLMEKRSPPQLSRL